MENKKTEKKRIFSKLTVCVAALALVSCAFVGGTFARYTTGKQSAAGGATIADWNVYSDPEITQQFVISPNSAKFNGGEGQNTIDIDQDASKIRSYTVSEGGTVLKITNGSTNISARVVITLPTADPMVMMNKDGEIVSLPTDTDDQVLYGAWKDVTLEQIFTYTGQGEKPALTVRKFDKDGGSTKVTAMTEGEYDGKYVIELKPDEYVEVDSVGFKWTTDIDGDTKIVNDVYSDDMNVWEGDIRDSWIGENVYSVGWQINWYAEQLGEYQTGGTATPTPPPAP